MMQYTIVSGTDIFTMDDDEIGQVKEIRGEYFKVDAASQPDYWLSVADVSAATEMKVVLNFDKDHLGDHKVDESRIAS